MVTHHNYAFFNLSIMQLFELVLDHTRCGLVEIPFTAYRQLHYLIHQVILPAPDNSGAGFVLVCLREIH